MSLTAKQEMFCQEYLKDLNATQAAIRAGYSEKAAKEQGSRLLTKANIQERVSELKSIRSDRVAIDADWVLLKAKESFEFNAQPISDKDGNPQMVNASAASKFLEICGKHVDVQAFTKDKELAEEAQPLNITFEVRQPVDEVKTTNAKPE